MILVDANLLVYAHVSDFAEHEAFKRWLDGHRTRTWLRSPSSTG